MARKKCKMCKVKKKLWESDNFFGIKCNKHFIPIIILKEHRMNITEKEINELLKICNEKYPRLYLDNTITDSDEHWHIHLSKKNKHITL